MFRCELCDNGLFLFQSSRLCESCYKIRTIIKCYTTEEILNCLEDNFKVKQKICDDIEQKALAAIDNMKTLKKCKSDGKI